MDGYRVAAGHESIYVKDALTPELRREVMKLIQAGPVASCYSYNALEYSGFTLPSVKQSPENIQNLRLDVVLALRKLGQQAVFADMTELMIAEEQATSDMLST